MNRAFSVLLSAVLTVSMLGGVAFADENTTKGGEYTIPGSQTEESAGTQTSEELTGKDNSLKDKDGGSNSDSQYTLPGEQEENSGNTADENNDKNSNESKDGKTPSVNDNGEKNEAPLQDKYKSDKVTVNLKMIPRMQVIDSFAVLQLCDKVGNVLGEKSEWVGGITENLTYEFTVPEYFLGENFVLKLKSGLVNLKYYDDTYAAEAPIKLETYVYTDENGNVIEGNSFSLDACPEFEHAIVVYVEGKQMNVSPRARLIDGVSMIPVRAIAEQLGLDVKYDERYNSVVCQIGDKQAIFNIGTDYATFFGSDLTLPHKCEIISDTTFVPVRSLAEAFGSTVEAIDFGDHIDVLIGAASKVTEYMMQVPVNKWGLSSKTNYLVWIDKSDYRVRVYTGSQYKWKQAASFPCAIGAPNTPTVTGSFEYLYKASSWDYPGYYVGPCLVFYGGYALHSTLLRYNGVPYDDRVETMISHGCVRLHKSDIDWIAARLPIGSRVYVTE